MSDYLGPRKSVTLRIPTSLKRQMTKLAKVRGVSLNELITDILRQCT